MNNHTLTQEVIIPSRGYLNPGIPDGKVVQRCMMVYDQKYLAGSASMDGGLKRLIKETTISPENLDVEDLTIADTIYLLFTLRSLSYGKDFRYSTRCPACGSKIDVTVDLSALEIFDLDVNFKENLKIKLPHKGDTVYTRILFNRDLREINEEIDRVVKRLETTDAIDTEYILKLSKMIVKIELSEEDADGERVLTDPVDIRKYVNNLTDYDATAIFSTIESISYGVSDFVEVKCSHCRRLVDVSLQFDASFFRPRYDIPNKRSRR